ncbi:MAG: Asp-tRNA(Asn)/Glu-tRNA(Gln) amidotransferase subunit GatB [candidate division Zixibacteria bacterium]|nr:Asp-tRNA(Asn)/Glu-tRNA(Gln) amidotransferase subunit GatB [candidate division Zixibacteria bacterium]
MKFEAVIGLETHLQLLTDSKIFCHCPTKFGGAPNTQTCPICLGMPGVLPVLNKKAVEYAVRMALAVGGKINPKSVFARKNYFYPDLPKGYQISQYEEPLSQGGVLEIETESGKKKIGITRIHLEEDAGKSMHVLLGKKMEASVIDMNRCGVPLIEIVTEPDFRSSKEAGLYLSKIRQLAQYLEISTGNMEEGALRCDANVSIRPEGQKKFGTKIEVKNMNSFKSVEKALEFEIHRQIKALEAGETIEQITGLWDEEKEVVIPMRGKEESHDYRYFPEPDLMVLEVDEDWLGRVQSDLPELPEAKRDRFVGEFHIPEYDAEVLTMDRHLAEYFESIVSATSVEPKRISNWIMTETLRHLKENGWSFSELEENIPMDSTSNVVTSIVSGEMNYLTAKEIYREAIKSKKPPGDILRQKGLQQVSDTKELEAAVAKAIEQNPNEVKRYKQGEEKLLGFLVGQVMKQTGGKANPKIVNKMMAEKLGGSKS